MINLGDIKIKETKAAHGGLTLEAELVLHAAVHTDSRALQDRDREYLSEMLSRAIMRDAYGELREYVLTVRRYLLEIVPDSRIPGNVQHEVQLQETLDKIERLIL